jgi:DNA-binding NarL/FixJ family response regulator
LENKYVTILIVEDNAAVRKIIRRAISHLPVEIYECEDGAYALKAYTRFKPDLVFMDVRMPRIDGLAATKSILSIYPDARIVIVTDHNEEELIVAAFMAGAKGYALKDNLGDLEAFVLETRTE